MKQTCYIGFGRFMAELVYEALISKWTAANPPKTHYPPNRAVLGLRVEVPNHSLLFSFGSSGIRCSNDRTADTINPVGYIGEAIPFVKAVQTLSTKTILVARIHFVRNTAQRDNSREFLLIVPR